MTVTIDNLVKAEINRILGREATETEINDAIQCINDNAGLIDDWADIRNTLLDWRDENYFKCLLCEEYHHDDEKQTVHDEYDDGYYYCEKCIRQAREDAEFDKHFELGTDGRHTC